MTWPTRSAARRAGTQATADLLDQLTRDLVGLGLAVPADWLPAVRISRA